jgi:prepilin-type N-terminal cleavage/methylation domain-containing protein
MTGPLRQPASRDGERGFTLIEMLVTVAILATVVVVLTSVLISSGRLQSRTVRQAENQMDVRQAVGLLATEVRQAGTDPRDPPVGIVGVVSADSVSLRVRADLNGDGAIQTAEPSEDVTYSFSSGARTLSRNPGTGASVLLPGVSAMRLSYFDAANQPLTALPLSAADAALVHSVGLTITATDRDSLPITITTRVTLRNQ